jgi:hypothetical protein
MSQTELRKPVRTAASQDYFQLFFEGADLYSSFWQPMLKSVGRWHLELAGLGVKNSQAALQLSRDLSRSLNPVDAVGASIRYWETVSSQYSQSSGRLAASVSRTVEAPFVSEIVALPLKRAHDLIVLPDTDHEVITERKVA